MSYHVDSTPGTNAPPPASTLSIRSVLLNVRLRRALMLFVLGSLLVVPLARTGEEKPVAVALIVALAVTLGVALHRPGPQRV